jgi:hypothetical protein
MKLLCPKCDVPIPGSQLNVQADVGLCRTCDEVFRISALVTAGLESGEADLSDPPSGCWFQNSNTGWTLGTTTRSPIAFFLVPFLCVWSGFSLGAIYGSQIAAGSFDPAMSAFGIPFMVGTLIVGSLALMSVIGQIVVTVDRNRGQVFTGVGRIGWKRDFDWGAMCRVEELGSYFYYPWSGGQEVVLIGKTRIRFGSMLTDPRRYFILQALRTLLASRQQSW